VDETDRARAPRVGDDRRKPLPHPIQLLEKRQRATEDATTTRNPGGGDQHEPLDPVGLPSRELRRHHSAQRMPDDTRPVESCGG
jgi:hypothetical protein